MNRTFLKQKDCNIEINNLDYGRRKSMIYDIHKENNFARLFLTLQREKCIRCNKMDMKKKK